MPKKSMDGNTAAAHIAYAFSEVSAIYPITPSTGMAELVEDWASEGKKNLFNETVQVVEMQSEAGAAGAVHGIVSAGAFSSTFTASQGLLLMIPNMYKIAGELLPVVFHVSARALATEALSIFGDHQDVMAARATGFCFLCSSSVQEVMDLALVSHLSTLRSSLPFLHFFDGFRTSHEIQKIEVIDYQDILPLVDQKAIQFHRDRALNPEHPLVKGTAQNPDIYFQENEALNSFYQKVPQIVEEEMDKLFKLTGRRYHLFDYIGHPEAEKVIVMMGSGAETAEETIKYLLKKGEKIGLLKVRLFRPFSLEHFIKVLPKSVKKIAVLDRTKENGAFGEPLYLEVSAVLKTAGKEVLIVGGRYGLGSKEFLPSQVLAVFDNLALPEPKNHFTVGITDDVTYLSLPIREEIDPTPKGLIQCKFWGIGGDGTVGANKDAIKIIGDNTDLYVQGHFAYDSKKTSGVTLSHLRFGKEPILSTYQIQHADYIACHHPSYVHKYNLLKGLKKGGAFVLNSPWTLADLERHLPNRLKKEIAENEVVFYNIDAAKLAKELGLGHRINMIMQTVFFKLSNILPLDKAVSLLKQAIEKTYRKKGEKVVLQNQMAVDRALETLEKISYPSSWKTLKIDEEKEDFSRPEFIRNVVDVMNAQEGDLLPVSCFTPGGEFPLSTASFEKRNIAEALPEWVKENCIQCNQCAFVCPHAAIRPFLLDEEQSKKAPKEFEGLKGIGKGIDKYQYSICVSPKDCTGCGNCIEICPAVKGKALVWKSKEEVEEKEEKIWDYVHKIPPVSGLMNKFTVKGSQFEQPLLEFSGACAGCGETSYVKLLTQLFGERMIISNATGCSSIWGASAPSIPWTTTAKGKGPAWANSLFEDNAEFGFGIHLAYLMRREELVKFVKEALQENISEELKKPLEEWLLKKDLGEESLALAEKIEEQLAILSKEKEPKPFIQNLVKRKDLFTKPSIWMVGGDGWAYDIGFGGLDHVMAMNQPTRMLVLDTEVYSNTGGQASKSTPLGAAAKFAALGKRTMKKDLALMAMTYKHVYVASICMGADMQQAVKAMKEAESFDGPSLIIAYAPCIAHGFAGGMTYSQQEGKKAVESGYWFCYRYDPRLKKEGKNPFQLDSKEPKFSVEEFLSKESRYQYLMKKDPEEAKKLHEELAQEQKEKYLRLKKWSEEGFFL
jgi:pyruvate-ferredoxin/flavodoxin oxidoreductase